MTKKQLTMIDLARLCVKYPGGRFDEVAQEMVDRYDMSGDERARRDRLDDDFLKLKSKVDGIFLKPTN